MRNSYAPIRKVSPCERKRRQLRDNYFQAVNSKRDNDPVVVPTQQSTLTKIIKFFKGESNDNS